MHILDKSVFENSYPKLLWIEDLPEDWTVARLHQVADLRPSNVDKKSQEDEDEVQLCNYTDVYYNDFITRDIDFSYATAPQRQIERFELKAGDVVITKDSEDWEDIGVPAYVPQDLDNVICGYHLFLIRPLQRIIGHYLFWCLKSTEIAYQFSVEASGVTRYGLSQQSAKYVVLPIPPIDEQKAIATYLNEETARIDALIAEFQEMLEELAEKRISIISHAMRHHYVEFISDEDFQPLEFPSNWEIVLLKYLSKYSFQYGANESGFQGESDDPRYIRITDINDDGTLRDDTYKSLPMELAEPYLLEDGDILFARSGATVGKTFLYSSGMDAACYAGYLIRFRPNKNVLLPKFLKYFTESKQYWGWIGSRIIQATIQNVSAEKYANLELPVPPINEQRDIVEYLDRESNKIAKLQQETKQAIDLLKERRIALISAAVTGKIRVTK